MNAVMVPLRRRAADRFKPDLGAFPPPPTANQDCVSFWLRCWLRSAIKRQKLQAFVTDSPAVKSATGIDYVLSLSIASALGMMRRQEEEDLRNLVLQGGLLFAWEGTTKGGAA